MPSIANAPAPTVHTAISLAQLRQIQKAGTMTAVEAMEAAHRDTCDSGVLAKCHSQVPAAYNLTVLDEYWRMESVSS